MTGRDYKQLMRLHRETKQFIDPNNENHKQLSRLVDSAHNATLIKYQPVNYDLFKNFIQMRKEAAVDSLDKVKKIEDVSKQKREFLFMKNHAIIWFKEWTRLINQLKNTEIDLNESFKFKHNSIDYINLNEDMQEDGNEGDNYFNLLNEIDEIEKYSQELNEDRIKFKVRTIHPINDLQEDLKFCLQKNFELKNNPEQYKQIINTVKAVKSQQAKIYEKLDLDAKKATDELNEASRLLNFDEMTIEEGVPAEAFDLISPDEELKFSVLQEFIIIDFKYKEKLNHVDENHKSLERGGKFSGWTQEQNDIFQHIYEQYHFHNINLVNCNFSLRDLLFDRIRRTFQNKFKVERAELIKHEEWNNTNKYFNQQRKLIISEWNESRRSLLLKAEAIFAEAFDLIDQQRLKKEEKEKQLKICNDLYEKVTKWRNQKLEALEIQQKIDELIKKQNLERIKFESERISRQREQEKQAIKNYKDRIEFHKKQQELDEQNKLNRLQKTLEEQAEKDRERIELRNAAFRERINQLKAQKEKKQMEAELKEKRLEKFYESVKPNVEADPARMISYTEAELNRRGIVRKSFENENSRYEEQKPLFHNYSFNDKQINADARLRIEKRLRQAGLINSEYARSLMNTVKPPTQPRRDQNENTNWNGFGMKIDN